MRCPGFLLLLAAALTLSGCAGGNSRPEAGRYDFGSPADSRQAPAVGIGSVEVQARSWLASADMQYRLAYADTGRRYSYVDSRWAAPPAELLERFLTRRIVFGQRPDAAGAGCRLRLVLDDLIQDFADARSSQVSLEASAVLLPARGGEPLARRALQVRAPAPTADAAGGVQATRAAAQTLADDIDAWLAAVAKNPGTASSRCQ